MRNHYFLRGAAGDHRRSVPPDPGDGADRPHQPQAEEEHRHGAGEAAVGEAGGADGQRCRGEDKQ